MACSEPLQSLNNQKDATNFENPLEKIEQLLICPICLDRYKFVLSIIFFLILFLFKKNFAIFLIKLKKIYLNIFSLKFTSLN